MNPDKLTEVISNEVDKRIAIYVDNQYKRGVVSAVSGNYADVKINGASVDTPNVPVIIGFTPTVSQMVLIINMGASGANMLIIGALD